MTNPELINGILAAVRSNDKEEVLRLLALGKKVKDPILNLHYLEGLFWIMNADLNRARTSLFKELRQFPQNRNAAKLFILLQPVSQSSLNRGAGILLRSIDYLFDDIDTGSPNRMTI